VAYHKQFKGQKHHLTLLRFKVNIFDDLNQGWGTCSPGKDLIWRIRYFRVENHIKMKLW